MFTPVLEPGPTGLCLSLLSRAELRSALRDADHAVRAAEAHRSSVYAELRSRGAVDTAFCVSVADDLGVDAAVVKAGLRTALALEGLPATRAAWSAGEVSAAHVAQVVGVVGAVEDPVVRAVLELAVLDEAAGLPPKALHDVAAAAVAAADPAAHDARYLDAKAARYARYRKLPDGMASLTFVDDAVTVTGRWAKSGRGLRPSPTVTQPRTRVVGRL